MVRALVMLFGGPLVRLNRPNPGHLSRARSFRGAIARLVRVARRRRVSLGQFGLASGGGRCSPSRILGSHSRRARCIPRTAIGPSRWERCLAGSAPGRRAPDWQRRLDRRQRRSVRIALSIRVSVTASAPLLKGSDLLRIGS
jgi:hypothetical protein